MSNYTNPLASVKVASPCPADWDSMIGNDRVKFCGQCSLNVYNLSDMTKKEAENLITRTEGRLCVKFYQRTDGSIITDNCPVGLRAVRKKVVKLTTAVGSAMFSFLAGIGINLALDDHASLVSVKGHMMGSATVVQPQAYMLGQMNLPEAKRTMGRVEVKGEIGEIPAPDSRLIRRHKRVRHGSE